MVLGEVLERIWFLERSLDLDLGESLERSLDLDLDLGESVERSLDLDLDL